MNFIILYPPLTEACLYKVSREYRTGKLVTTDMHSLAFRPFLLSYFNSCYRFFFPPDCEMNQEFLSSKPIHFQAKVFAAYFEYFFFPVLPSLITLIVLSLSPWCSLVDVFVDNNHIASLFSFCQVQHVQHFLLLPVRRAVDSPVYLTVLLSIWYRFKGSSTKII